MSIILSAIKRSLRDKNTIIGTIFLVIMLPYIFSIIFSFDSVKESLDISIVGNKNSEINKSYVKALEEFDKENEMISLDYKIYNKEELDKNIEEVNKSNLTVIIDDKNRNIKFEGSKKLSMGEEVIEGITKEFFNLMSVYESVAKEGEVPSISNNLVKVSEYKSEGNKNLIAEDIDYGKYFSVVMLQMAILAVSACSFKNTFYIKENIGERAKSSPMKISKLMSLELIGSFIVIFGQGIIMLLAISILYGVNITKQNLLGMIALISVLSMLSVCIGLFASSICKKRSVGENVCSIIVTVMALASGELMPKMEQFAKNIPILKLNPFVWISKEFNSLVTLNYSENLYTALGVGIIASIVLMAISILILSRKVVK
ncbi:MULTISPECIES: ABC transporter permease [unclassified Romboutsia]|uniref:ABC transporter permease n=1 Tax=unclassified Romboutsia TaxID=2626894 RepID=UPI0018970BC6|nr:MULTISPECIES: ABC transporter permease [unclassified Romboutsia]MDB8789096.1 ABC transporter permease [Romboutsia sp. 1001216sp1]MDB8805228.1 ABC transporter permease [Romboutsia sp. 1001216sp1]MDB8807098.1 ABC transporter permease [Romboutsia sp. 1001216sp1]MDB8810873.1 ABC transporter permease [Romboutsia sp. 1001216sp1]MDB8816593.1 ABC transporter permease [Romboutsia sp. 1001216sp1]